MFYPSTRPSAPSTFTPAAMKLDFAYALPGEGVVSSFHNTPTHILIGLNDGKIHVLDINGGLVHTLLEPIGSVWALAASERTLLNGGKDASLRVWDLISGLVTEAKLSALGNSSLAYWRN